MADNDQRRPKDAGGEDTSAKLGAETVPARGRAGGTATTVAADGGAESLEARLGLGRSAARPARGALLDRFEVESELGRGGMGLVLAARDPELDRRVAIKLLHHDTPGSESSGAEARLLREAQALAKLSHPNVVAVHEVGTLEREVFVVMEYVEGTTLSTWLAKADRSWREIIATFRQAGLGLAVALWYARRNRARAARLARAARDRYAADGTSGSKAKLREVEAWLEARDAAGGR